MKLVMKITRESADRYRAACPSLPGCVVFGTDPQEAQEKLAQAARSYLASLDAEMPLKFSQPTTIVA